MKFLFRILTNRWLWAVIGLLLLALAIWFGGPFLSIGQGRSPFVPLASQIARLSTIFVVVLLWGLSQFLKVLRASKANQGMVEGLVEAESAAPDRSAEEVATLKDKFEQAVAILRKSKGKRRRLNLYDLPWYIIIGPPGSGKTTALVNSGLDFPLADEFGREALSGIGGTRNCDWWFTDEAILIDTAGRYTTQDSDSSVDRSAWEGFLALLKKYRRRRPINGVLVAISLEDLMTQTEQERIAHARAIKSRIQELDQFFRIRFPVYVMLTKTDLVAGFNEFFDDLGRHEREQVWGVTFPYDLSESGRAAERFGPEFDALLEQLGKRVLLRMSQERDLRRRVAVYNFPRQLASMQQNLQSFLNDIFRGSRFEPAPLLRGVYLTSGTQEGTPIDRLMGVVARTFGLDQQVYAAQGGQGRSYFIKSLLSDVVFNESEVAGTNRKFELQRAWLQRAAYVGCIALVAVMVVGWAYSYINNGKLIQDAGAWTDETREAIDDISGNPENIVSVVRALNAVENLTAQIDERAGGFGNVSHGLGLSQAGKLTRRADTVYAQLLEDVLLPRLVHGLEEVMTDPRATDDEQYETLKHYLMLDSQGNYDAESIIGFFWNLRGRWLGRGDDEEAFQRHLEALFADRPTIGQDYLDPNLIDQTQRIVAGIPIERRVYNRIRNDGEARSLPPFNLIDAAGRDAERVFARASGAALTDPIPGIYTRAGWEHVLSRLGATADVLLDERWILGPYAPSEDIDDTAVRAAVLEIYLNDYIAQYDNLLRDLRIRSFRSVAEAAEILDIMSLEDRSPLARLMLAVSDETRLAGDDAEEDDDDSGAARPDLSRLFGLGTQAETGGNAVDEHFKWLHDFAGADGDAGALQAVVAQLEELALVMMRVADQSASGGTIDDALIDQGTSVLSDVEREARRQPDVVRGLVDAAASSARSVAFNTVLADLNRLWGEHYAFCTRAIEGRYPINREATQEISLNDFAEFFGPNGRMDTFFRQHLAEYVNTTTRHWEPRPSNAVPVRLSTTAVAQFERARRIRDTFFGSGSAVPRVDFVLTPRDMDAEVEGFTLSLEGQVISYFHDLADPRPMQWPGPQPGSGVSIQMSPGGAFSRQEGQWAWFRLLDESGVTPGNLPERFAVDFTIGNRWAQYTLDAGSAYNPFDFEELAAFSCPETL